MRSSNVDVYVRLRNARQFQAQIKGATNELERMGIKGAGALSAFASKADSLKNFGASWSRNVTLPIVALGAVAGKVDVEFDSAMRNVNSIAQLSEKNFQSLRGEVSELAPEVAQSPTALADSLYDLVSSGFSASESLRILRSSANAATAGMTDAATSTKVVAGVLNAYQLPAGRAQKVSDQLFQTVKLGVISFEELSQSLGDVLPFAAALNVPLQDVGASISTMTKAGINAPETMTRIKAVLSSLIKPSGDLKNTIEGLGYESGEAMIKALGFQGTLEALQEATGGSKEELAKLFPNIRAVAGVLALTGDNAATAEADLKGMSDSAGATNEALNQIKQSEAYKLQELKSTFEALATEIMPPLIDAVVDLAQVLGTVAGWFGDLPAPVQQAAIYLILAAAAVGPLAYLLGGLATIVGGATIALATFGGALEVVLLFVGLSVGAFAAIVLAVLAVGAAFVIAYMKVRWFRNGVNDTLDWLKENWPAVAYVITGPFGFAIKWVIDHWGGVTDFFGGLGGKIGNALSNVWGAITHPFREALDWIVGKVEWVLARIQEITEKLDSLSMALPGQSADLGDLFGDTPQGRHLLRELGVAPGAAEGGVLTSGGTIAVGEHGAELLDLPAGARVRPLRGDDDNGAGLRGLIKLTADVLLQVDGRELAKVVAENVETSQARS